MTQQVSDLARPPQQFATLAHQIAEALRQAQAHLAAGRQEAAAQTCHRILAASPGEPHALHMLGLIAYSAGNAAAAIADLRQACAAPTAPAAYHSNLAEMLRQHGQLNEAERHGRRAVALDPQLPGAWNNLGIILQESGALDESRECLTKVIALEPGNASAHNNLGNTLKRLDDLHGAERSWRRALAINPNYAEPHSNLANLLREQGQYDRAIESGQQAIRINPALLDAYINLAAVETARFRPAAALGWLDRLLRIAPDHALGLAARASALKDLDRLDEAIAQAERAALLRPDNAEVLSTLGAILLAQGRFDAAVGAFDRALALPSATRERVLVTRAMAFQENGQSGAALDQLNAVLIEYPRAAAAWHGMADIMKFTAGDPAIAKMERLLSADGVQSHADRISLHFALSKAYLDCGDSALAFRHLDQGNAMKRATLHYDANATTHWLRAVAAAYDAPLLERLGGLGAASSAPIFVLGMPRSGTTLIEQILASHHEIHGAGEVKFLGSIVDAAGGSPNLAAALDTARLKAMGEDYLRRIGALGGGKRHVVDKMPANFIHAGLIHLILPGARIIHARRDPVDTCLSCYSKLFGGEQAFAYDQAELGQFYRDYGQLMDHWRGVLPATHFLEVDYEDMVADTEGQARRMLDFLELEWDPACLAFHETARPVRTASVNQVRQPIYNTSAGRWRKHAANLGPLLHALGMESGRDEDAADR